MADWATLLVSLGGSQSALLVVLLVGAVQGVAEWLPISSEGSVTILLTTLGYEPELAVRLALFLHVGTALSATVYYRSELRDVLVRVPEWRPRRAFEGETARLTFLGIATVVSGVVGIAAYVLLLDAATALSGGAFIALIGVLLLVTGGVQRATESTDLGERELPDGLDAMLVGVGQGLAILPGVSRSGTTASVLLFRGHDGESAFELSFLLSIPAAVGAGVLTVLDTGGAIGVTPETAVVALAASAVVGYATIDALMRIVRRVAFWAVCVGLGVLAIAGGTLLLL